MNKFTEIARIARNATIGVLALGATALVSPGTAQAEPGPQKVAQKLERIAYDTNRISSIRGPRRQDAAIDNLQKKLRRLDRVSDRQRGRLARRNDARIDRLKHRLNRMERRIEARLERRDDRRDWRRDDRRDWQRDGDWRRDRGYRSPVAIFGGGWRN